MVAATSVVVGAGGGEEPVLCGKVQVVRALRVRVARMVRLPASPPLCRRKVSDQPVPIFSSLQRSNQGFECRE